jgi:hypothetical protein
LDGVFGFSLCHESPGTPAQNRTSATHYSRSALREATCILLEMPKPDPDRFAMSLHLQEERRFNSSADALLVRLFLLVPRAATYDVAALPGAALTDLAFSKRSGKDSGGGNRTRSAD